MSKLKNNRKTDTQKTVAFKAQMKIGAALADQLPKLMGLQEAADKMGMSYQMLRRIECQALYKVATRMRAAAANE
jgi:hypothetical protein